MKKPKLLLLDSDVVITCHEVGVWQDLKAKYDVHVTSIVATVEAMRYKRGNQWIDISLEQEEKSGGITIVQATAPEMAEVTNLFTNSFAQGMDDGETEGLAVIKKGKLADCRFCTGDTNAIQAVGMLALGGQSISLEDVLSLAGIKIPSPHKLPPHLTERSREAHVRTGAARRISGECFIKSPLSL
jgi:hypothetical protein